MEIEQNRFYHGNIENVLDETIYLRHKDVAKLMSVLKKNKINIDEEKSMKHVRSSYGEYSASLNEELEGDIIRYEFIGKIPKGLFKPEFNVYIKLADDIKPVENTDLITSIKGISVEVKFSYDKNKRYDEGIEKITNAVYKFLEN